MKTKFFLLAGLLILMTAATHIHPSSGAAEHKSFNKPEEVRTFSLGKLELVTLHGAKLGRATFQPGWKWSTSL